MSHRYVVLLVSCLAAAAGAQEETYVRYLANEGVMVVHEDTKILFDPLYDNGFNNYQMVPDDVRKAIFLGESPFDGIDAVFISHFHGDHFSAADVVRLLQGNDSVRVYAPAQAVAGLRAAAGDATDSIFERVVGLDLDYGDSPARIEAGNLLIEAAPIPHSGWPTARTDVQNLAFRITVGGRSTVLHLGDADAKALHFDLELDFWERRRIDLALPPYWFFLSEGGTEILDNQLTVLHSIGIHVPADFENAANIPPELGGRDLFTHPGEGRRFLGTQ